MTDAETYIYAFTSCHGDAYFGSFAELKDHAVIGPVSVVGPFVDERAAADHVGKWGRFNTRMLEIGETPLSIIVKSVPDEVRDDVTAAIEAVARQGSVPTSFNLVYFASSSPTNTASKTA